MSSVGLILLAAGGSKRLGEPKQLLRLHGQTLLRRAATTAVRSVCRPIIVVLGAEHTQMLTELTGLPVRTVVNPNWERGIGTSIRAGMESLTEDATVDGAVIALCDQPYLTAAHLNALVAMYQQRSASIIASIYGGDAGVPALFDRPLFQSLQRLPDSEGAKRLIQDQQFQLITVPFSDGAIDIDTPEDRDSLVNGEV